MRLIDADLLEKKCKGSYLTPDDFRFEIRNAPTVESDFACYVWNGSLEYMKSSGNSYAHLRSCIGQQIKPSSEYTALYTSPKQSQSVADALEEAIKIAVSYCQDGMHPDDLERELRTLITVDSYSDLREQLRLQILECQRLNKLLEN